MPTFNFHSHRKYSLELLYLSGKATITKCHRLSDVNYRNSSSLTVWKAGSPRSRSWHIWFWPRLVFLPYRWLPYFCVLVWSSLLAIYTLVFCCCYCLKGFLLEGHQSYRWRTGKPSVLKSLGLQELKWLTNWLTNLNNNSYYIRAPPLHSLYANYPLKDPLLLSSGGQDINIYIWWDTSLYFLLLTQLRSHIESLILISDPEILSHGLYRLPLSFNSVYYWQWITSYLHNLQVVQ